MRQYILAVLLALGACSVPETADAARQTSAAPTVTIADVTCNEGTPACTLTITKGRAKSYSKISITTADTTARAGSDYAAVNQQITMGNNQTTATVTVPIIEDSQVEGSEQFAVIIKSVRNAVIGRSPATVTITDNDTVAPPAPASPTFAISNVTVNENVGNATLTVTKTGTNGSSSTVTYASANGTAAAGSDYTSASGTLTFADVDTQKLITVPITDDATAEGDETFTVTITRGTNASITQGVGTVTILSSDPVTPTPPPAPTQTCPDGSVILASATCPAPPTPTSPGWVDSPSITGLDPIASEFNYTSGLGTAAVPGLDVGEQAFRFLCGTDSTQLKADDPLLYPGQPGKSHLHQFYGNTGANAYSTYNSLRTTGGSTCSNNTYPVNRSAYWQPAMFDGKGNVVQPDYSVIYYKKPPNSKMTGWKQAPSADQSEGINAKLPNGIRFIFGWDPTGVHTSPTGSAYYYCAFGNGGSSGHYPDIPSVASICTAGQNNSIIYTLEAPSCWDGAHLDSPDHRSHVAYADYSNGYGYQQCPQAFPYVIPQFTLKTFYLVAAGDDPTLWSLSSDAMAPTKPHGYTIHGDFFMAWDPTVHGLWEDNCLNLMLNCSGGNTGDGHIILNADHPPYGWTNPTHLVPLSSL